MLSIPKTKILMDDSQEKNFIFLVKETGTEKYFFNKEDKIDSIPNKPPNYFIKMKNRCIDNQLLSNVKGEVIELVPTCNGSSANFFNKTMEQPGTWRPQLLRKTRHTTSKEESATYQSWINEPQR